VIVVGENVKTFVLWIFLCLGLLAIYVQDYLAGLSYQNDLGSYYNLAVDSSTAKLKLKYLQKYREKIKELDLEHGYGAWLIKLPDKRLENQVTVLDSIIERLEAISDMDEKSFEYQQALYQISRNELCHEGSETAGCFREQIIECGYKIKKAFFVSGLIFCI